MSTVWQQKYPVPVSSRYGFFLNGLGNGAAAATAEMALLLPQIDCGGRFARGVFVQARGSPGEHPLVAREAIEFGAAFVGEHRDIDGSMETGARRHRALANRLHQAETA